MNAPAPLAEFIATHTPALERDEARHNLILGILERAAADSSYVAHNWTLGGPGSCAVETMGRPIVLGDLDRLQCRDLAERANHLDYPGVIGPESTALWFVERAVELGSHFAAPIPQRIHALGKPAIFPASDGHLHQATSNEAKLLLEWMKDFGTETNADALAAILNVAALEAGDYSLWVADGRPVSMAYINRRSRNTATISGVYTPPEFRQRGFAGSVTAGVADRILAEGRAAACLYTDLRNPHSNRCYAKIGFTPVCDSSYYGRRGRP